jgi:regulator of cell morphogenesis and NO signaling
MEAIEFIENKTVGQLVAERPARARVFEQFGIDYCCGGKVPLMQACKARNIDPRQVLEGLARAATPASGQTDWSAATLTQLADHIEYTHHAYLKTELPRLDLMTAKVASAHGDRHPQLLKVREVFVALKTDMDSHMAKEEGIFFPACRRLEQTTELSATSLEGPIGVLTHEHDDAGRALSTLRELTFHYTPPTDACNTFRAMLDSLQQLEADMHQHVHKENNILFPKAAAVELERAAGQ